MVDDLVDVLPSKPSLASRPAVADTATLDRDPELTRAAESQALRPLREWHRLPLRIKGSPDNAFSKRVQALAKNFKGNSKIGLYTAIASNGRGNGAVWVTVRLYWTRLGTYFMYMYTGRQPASITMSSTSHYGRVSVTTSSAAMRRQAMIRSRSLVRA